MKVVLPLIKSNNNNLIALPLSQNILNNKVNNNKYFVIFVVMQNDKNIELSPNFININLIYRFFLNFDSMDMQIENLRGLYFSGYPFR